jgi:hypothetical protein
MQYGSPRQKSFSQSPDNETIEHITSYRAWAGIQAWIGKLERREVACKSVAFGIYFNSGHRTANAFLRE